jgi:hypothetical protein
MPRIGGAIKRHARRGGRALARGAYSERYRLGAIAGGFLLGLVDKSGVDLPTIPLLGKAGTAGVLLWALGKWGRMTWADHAATGVLSIAAYELATKGAISGDHGTPGVAWSG